MPYGRKTTKRHHTRHRVHHHKRRRMRGMGAAGPKGQLLTILLAAGAGGLIARYASDKLFSFLPASLDAKTQQYIKAGVLALGGAFLAFKMKSTGWQAMAKGAGVGIFVEGVHSFGQATGLVTGMGRTDPASLVFPRGAKVGNYYNVHTINGGTDFPRPGTVGGHRRPAVSVMGGM